MVRNAPPAVRQADVAVTTFEDLAYGSLVGLTAMFVLFTLRSLVTDAFNMLLRRSPVGQRR